MAAGREKGVNNNKHWVGGGNSVGRKCEGRKGVNMRDKAWRVPVASLLRSPLSPRTAVPGSLLGPDTGQEDRGRGVGRKVPEKQHGNDRGPQ